MVASADRWTALAPVTDRGAVIGLLEVVLPAEPDSRTPAEIARTVLRPMRRRQGRRRRGG